LGHKLKYQLLGNIKYEKMKPTIHIFLLVLVTLGLKAQNVGIGTTTPVAKLHIEGDTDSTLSILKAHVNYSGLKDIYAIEGVSVAAPGWGYGAYLEGGFVGVQATANATDYVGTAYGVYGVSTGTAGFRIGIYGHASGGIENWAGFFDGRGYFSDSLGIGVPYPEERLDVMGGIRLGSASANNAGTIRYLNGLFEGNTTGTPAGWKTFNGPWVNDNSGNYFLSPVSGGGRVAIGDSLFSSSAKLAVKQEITFGGTGVHGLISKNGTTIAEGRIGYQYSNLSPFILSNMGVTGTVYDDSDLSRESFGVAGNNMERDSFNYGVYGIAQGLGNKNIGIYGTAQNGLDNWAGYFNGKAHISEELLIGTEVGDPDAIVHIKLPPFGTFPHLRIESPTWSDGFGITFKNNTHTYRMGQNIGGFADGRFSIFSDSSFTSLTILQNGDVGLTAPSFLTPFARFQVPQKGSLNNGGLDVTNAAIFIGETQTQGMAFDENQIESVGDNLNVNFNSTYDINLVDGGGNVGVGAGSAKAKFHVGEGKTVLFGKDMIGDGTVGSKLMWLPGQGGAFRAGLLSYDGSIGNSTTFWDPANVGWASIAIGTNTKASGEGSLAIGMRANASKLGSVAIGHLALCSGNSGVAAGYYTKAEAFVSCAVGAGNVGGGNPNLWVATDPIFEVGNSPDTSNRSNALTILKNSKVGINHSNPQAMLDIEQPNQGPGNGVLLNLAGIGHWETGVDNVADYNFYFNNVLKAYILDTDGSYMSTSDRRLKTNIQRMKPVLSRVRLLEPSTYQFIANSTDSPLSIGFIAQDVNGLFPEVVSSKNGYLGINYSGFAVIAIQAIKELADENDVLIRNNDALTNNIKSYRDKLEKLENQMNEMQLQIEGILKNQ
jgi:endosialidase-like protein/trimeric autotransporter adhesin